jgi:hypothetical protein
MHDGQMVLPGRHMHIKSLKSIHITTKQICSDLSHVSLILISRVQLPFEIFESALQI